VFKLGRLQAGTPARLDIITIDSGGLGRQDGDAVPSPFSFMNRTVANAVHSTLFIQVCENLTER
jgi:tRNA uridine 5-carboxymethylaminomethyl modification enzyme